MRKWLFILLFLILPVLSYASMINEWWLWEEEERGQVWKDPYLGMGFVYVKGGCYEMGDLFGDGYSDEKLVHEVCVDGFWMGRYEVTVGQFRRFVAETGYKTDAEKGGYCWIWDGEWKKKRGANWRDPKFSQDENHPVVCVSWNDVVAFAEWLSKKSGYSFRLPTEAEWEYACRSGGKKVKYGTSTGDLSHDLANYIYTGNGGRDRWEYTAPVGSFLPNELGIYDMSGNVWEWCRDWYDKDYYRKSLRDNPKGPSTGSRRVYRGGSWACFQQFFLRCAHRGSYSPEFRSNFLGFRLLRQK